MSCLRVGWSVGAHPAGPVGPTAPVGPRSCVLQSGVRRGDGLGV